eukprot:10667881-Alexandrium_andersonii.AAC.1
MCLKFDTSVRSSFCAYHVHAACSGFNALRDSKKRASEAELACPLDARWKRVFRDEPRILAIVRSSGLWRRACPNVVGRGAPANAV